MGSSRQPLPPRLAGLLPLTHQLCNKTYRQLVINLLTPRGNSWKAAAAFSHVQSHREGLQDTNQNVGFGGVHTHGCHHGSSWPGQQCSGGTAAHGNELCSTELNEAAERHFCRKTDTFSLMKTLFCRSCGLGWQGLGPSTASWTLPASLLPKSVSLLI